MLFATKIIGILFIIYAPSYQSIAINVVTIFRPDEIKFHKYAAVLAATQPLKMQCEKSIRENVNPFVLFFQNLRGILEK